MIINERECEAAGIDPDQVAKIARRLERTMKDADKIGVSLFCGSANTLRARDGAARALVVAELNLHNADGGCGAASEDDDGLIRGE